MNEPHVWMPTNLPLVSLRGLTVPSLTEKLQAYKDTLEQDLTTVNAALTALRTNPDVAAIVDTLSKVAGVFR